MPTIRLSLNKKLVNKTPDEDIRFSKDWFNVDLEPKVFAYDVIQKYGFAFSSVLKSNDKGQKKPSKDDILGSFLLPIDIDNDISKGVKKTEGYLSLDDALQMSAVKDNALFIYTTPSHTPDHHKFRIVYQSPIFLQEYDYEYLMDIMLTNLNGDPSTKNIDRLFFGSKNCEIFWFGNVIPEDAIKNMLKARNEEETVKADYDKSKLNGSLSEDDARQMLSVIPKYFGQDYNGYNRWGKIVSAIANYFPEDVAVRLIEEWSPDEKVGTAYRVRHASKKVTIASLIYEAKNYGYDWQGYLKNNGKGANKTADSVVSNDMGQSSASSKKEPLKSRIVSYMQFLDERYVFRKNEIRGWTEFANIPEERLEGWKPSWKQLTDYELNSIFCELEVMFGREAKKDLLASLVDSYYAAPFHPVKEYFNDLPEWDGDDYLNKIIKMVKPIEDQDILWENYFTKWITAVVASVIKGDPNHTCLVLVGPQGCGKTTFFNRLVPAELKDYYAIARISPENKDFQLLIVENFLINLDELEGSSKTELDHLKSSITVSQVTVRRPFGRRAETLPRLASFCGSVNKNMFMTDPTGSRRFLTIEVDSIDYNAQINHKQLFAQVKHAINNGAEYHFDRDEIEQINSHNRNYEIANPEEELLLKKYEPFCIKQYDNKQLFNQKEAGLIKLKTSTDILQELQDNNVYRLSPRMLGLILNKHKFEKRMIKINGVPQRYYALKPVTEGEINGELKEESAF